MRDCAVGFATFIVLMATSGCAQFEEDAAGMGAGDSVAGPTAGGDELGFSAVELQRAEVRDGIAYTSMLPEEMPPGTSSFMAAQAEPYPVVSFTVASNGVDFGVGVAWGDGDSTALCFDDPPTHTLDFQCLRTETSGDSWLQISAAPHEEPIGDAEQEAVRAGFIELLEFWDQMPLVADPAWLKDLSAT